MGRWILLGLIAWGLGALFVIVLLRMARNQDRAARRTERRLNPHADVTVTKPGQ